MRSDLHLALYAALALFAVGTALGWLGLGPTPAAEFVRHLRYPMLSLSVGPFAALFATVFFCAITDRRAAASVAAAGVAAAAAHLALYGVPQLEGIEQAYLVLTLALWLGVASLAALAWRAWRGANGDARRTAREALAGCLFILLWCAFLNTFLQATIELHPRTYDAMLYRFEATLGLQAAPLAARWIAGTPTVAGVLDAVYDYLTFGFAALYGFTLRRRAHPPVNLLLAWAIGAACAFVAYHLLPASGPRYLLGPLFPDRLPPLEAVPAAPTTVMAWPRRAMPALQAGWAIMFWAYARLLGWRWIERACLAVLALMLAAALARGEHYLIDLVVVVPFTAAVLATSLRQVAWAEPHKRRIVVAGFGAWLAWVVALRYGLQAFESVPGLAWLAIAATLWLGAVLFRAFFRIAPAGQGG